MNRDEADLRYGKLLDAGVAPRIARQIAYHFCRLDCEDPEYLAAKSMMAPFANKFHRVAECGAIEIGEEQDDEPCCEDDGSCIPPHVKEDLE